MRVTDLSPNSFGLRYPYLQDPRWLDGREETTLLARADGHSKAPWQPRVAMGTAALRPARTGV